MAGWIKVENGLRESPQVLRMASRLRHADVTLESRDSSDAISRSKLVIVGAMTVLWSYAYTHIGEDDVLPIGANEINQIVGIVDFCDILPADWLQVLDADRVYLPGFLAHNGLLGRKRALAQTRQARSRANNTAPSRSRHADVTPKLVSRDRGRVRDKKPPTTPFDASAIPGLDAFAWTRWREYRLTNKPIKPASMQAAALKLAKFGEAQGIVVENSIAEGYQGLFEPRTNGAAGKPQTAAPRSVNTAEWAEAKTRAAAIAFREPWPHESSSAYMQAVKSAESPRQHSATGDATLAALVHKMRVGQ